MSVCCSTRSHDFGTLCAEVLPGLYRHARRRLPATEVDDVVQETLLSALRSFARWRGDASFATWIYSILRRRIADFYRRRERMPDEVSLDAAVEVHPLNRHYETYVVVRMVLSRLSRRDQEVILLRLEQGLPFKKVAQRLGISLEAAKSRYRRAIQHFAEEWNA